MILTRLRWLATLALLCSGSLAASAGVEDVRLQVEARVHFNTNVSDFAAARAFYGKLGFKTLSGFPDTNTLAMARAIGIKPPTRYDGAQGEHAGGYLLHGELIGVGGFSGGLIDLIEFSIPRRETPPYARLNHLGMVAAVMLTADIDADYAYMRGIDVEFLSAPVARADGVRFAIFKDPDGTFYELRETHEEGGDTHITQITGLGPVVVNVSNFDTSLAWYEMFGFKQVRPLATTQSIDVARAMGFTEPFTIRGALLRHPADGAEIELVQWLQPFDPEPPYTLPINHYGIHRTAFVSADIAADVALLRGQGVKFVSDVTPCCSGDDSPGSIVAFYDPDGTIVELVEQPLMIELFTIMKWVRSWF